MCVCLLQMCGKSNHKVLRAFARLKMQSLQWETNVLTLHVIAPLKAVTSLVVLLFSRYIIIALFVLIFFLALWVVSLILVFPFLFIGWYAAHLPCLRASPSEWVCLFVFFHFHHVCPLGFLLM